MADKQYCAYHPSFPIVNFCRNRQCLLPLCQKCVKIHSNEHIHAGTYADLESIDELHQEIESGYHQKLFKILNLSQKLKVSCSEQMQNKQVILKKLRQMRPKILQEVSRYMDEVENEIIGAAKSFEISLQKQMEDIDNKIEELTEMVKQQIDNLDGNSKMQTIITNLSCKRSIFYDNKLLELEEMIKKFTNLQIGDHKQLKSSHLYSIMHEVGLCYWNFFKNLLGPNHIGKSNRQMQRKWSERDYGVSTQRQQV